MKYNTEYYQGIGKKVVALRDKKQMSQQELGVASGCSIRTINRVENASTDFKLFTLKKIVEGLGLTMSEFFDDKDL